MSASTHANAVVVGEKGVLIRGPSGSGKSRLAREIVAAATGLGLFARHVGDDRLLLQPRAGRLVARAAAPIVGRMEVRGLGIVSVVQEPAVVVRLVVELGTFGARFPEPADLRAEIAGIALPRLLTGPDQAALVLWRLRVAQDTFVTKL